MGPPTLGKSRGFFGSRELLVAVEGFGCGRFGVGFWPVVEVFGWGWGFEDEGGTGTCSIIIFV